MVSIDIEDYKLENFKAIEFGSAYCLSKLVHKGTSNYVCSNADMPAEFRLLWSFHLVVDSVTADSVVADSMD